MEWGGREFLEKTGYQAGTCVTCDGFFLLFHFFFPAIWPNLSTTKLNVPSIIPHLMYMKMDRNYLIKNSNLCNLAVPCKLAPIFVKYEMPHYMPTMLKVKYLKILERSGYEAAKFIRYICKGQQEIRTKETIRN